MVVIFVQSKLRTDILKLYPNNAEREEAGKCWSIQGVLSCLLFLTDERGRGRDNEALDVGDGVRVVMVSRDGRLTTFGVAVETLKRCREAMVEKEEVKKGAGKKHNRG